MRQVDTKKKVKVGELKGKIKPEPFLRAKKVTKVKSIATKVSKTTPKIVKKSVVKLKSYKIKKITDENLNTQITIPSSASLRLLEKVELYKQWYEVFLPQHAALIAKAFGFVFLILGSSFVTFDHFSNKDVSTNTAALICADDLCTKSEDVQISSGDPEVLFLNTLPDVLGSDNDIWIEFKNSKLMSLNLVSVFSGKKIKLVPVEKVTESKFRYLISKNELSGSYVITAEVEGVNGNNFIFKGQSFTIESEEVSEVENELTETTVNADDEIASTTEDVTISSTTNSVTATLTPEDGEEKKLIKNNPETFNKEVFSLSVENSSDSEFLKISTGNYTPDSVQIFAKVPGSPQKLFLGEATKVQDLWYFSLSALTLPNYTLSIFASLTQDDLEVESVTVPYEPKKTLTKDKVKNEDLAILAKKIDISLAEINIENEKRNNYFSNYILSKSEDEILNDLADRVDEISYFALIYAAALQPNNALFTKIARENLLNIFNQKEDADNNVDLETNLALSKNLGEFIGLIEESELSVSKSSSLLTEKDSDLDGVSDYDEYVNFATDPGMSDTDADGVIDSIEIATLNNPLESDIINYPDVGTLATNSFINKEIVSIDGIKKQVIKSSRNDKQVIFNLNGKTIPNSFVFVFSKNSNSVSVTRSSDQGNYSLAIENQDEDKPLIFEAVLVDNSGSVLVSSGEFTFDEKGNDQIATLFNGLELEYSSIIDDLRTSSILVLSLSLVILGFVLMFLSQSLKIKQRKFISVSR